MGLILCSEIFRNNGDVFARPNQLLENLPRFAYYILPTLEPAFRLVRDRRSVDPFSGSVSLHPAALESRSAH